MFMCVFVVLRVFAIFHKNSLAPRISIAIHIHWNESSSEQKSFLIYDHHIYKITLSICAVCMCKRMQTTIAKNRRKKVQQTQNTTCKYKDDLVQMRATHNHQKKTKILGACYTSNVEENRDDPIRLVNISKHTDKHKQSSPYSFFYFALEKWTHIQRLVIVVMYMPFRWVQTTVPFVDCFAYFFYFLLKSLVPHPIS